MRLFKKDQYGWRFLFLEWSHGEVFSMFWIGRLALAIDHSRAYYKRGFRLEWY